METSSPNLAFAAQAAPSFEMPQVGVEPSRPAFRLALAMNRVGWGSIAGLAAGGIVLLIITAALLAFVLSNVDFNWNQVPVIAIFGSFGYAAFPRRGAAFLSHFFLTTIFVSIVWILMSSQGYTWASLLLAALISAVFMEVWTWILRRLAAARSGVGWLYEAVWIVLMAVIGTTIFYAILTDKVSLLMQSPFSADQPLSLLFILNSAILGLFGWFLGDLIHQSILLRRQSQSNFVKK
jgi:hypothetical protein